MTDTIRRTSTSEAIVHHLIERIQGRDFGPGDRLPSERQLQQQLGVGRLALREGLARLSALGIIRIDHGRGAFVQERPSGGSLALALLPCFPTRDKETLEDFVNARALIEGELSALAATRRSELDIVKLRAILEHPNVKELDDAALADLDMAFHMEVARISGNAFLSIMLEALRSHIHEYLVHYARAVDDAERVVSRHLPILQAIIDKNEDQARQLARAHVEVCKSSLSAYVASKNSGNKSSA